MSWHNYLVIAEPKLLIDVGNVSVGVFRDEVEDFGRFFDCLYEDMDENLLDKDFKKLSISDISKLVNVYKRVYPLENQSTSLLGIAYGVLLKDKIEDLIVGEDKVDILEKKGYRVVSLREVK